MTFDPTKPTWIESCQKCGQSHRSETPCLPKTIADEAEPGLQSEIARPLSIHSEHPSMPPCDHDECGTKKCQYE